MYQELENEIATTIGAVVCGECPRCDAAYQERCLMLYDIEARDVVDLLIKKGVLKERGSRHETDL